MYTTSGRLEGNVTKLLLSGWLMEARVQLLLVNWEKSGNLRDTCCVVLLVPDKLELTHSLALFTCSVVSGNLGDSVLSKTTLLLFQKSESSAVLTKSSI